MSVVTQHDAGGRERWGNRRVLGKFMRVPMVAVMDEEIDAFFLYAVKGVYGIVDDELVIASQIVGDQPAGGVIDIESNQPARGTLQPVALERSKENR